MTQKHEEEVEAEEEEEEEEEEDIAVTRPAFPGCCSAGPSS